MHASRSSPSGMPTPRPTASALEGFDFVTFGVEVEAAFEGAVVAVTVTVASAAAAVEVFEALGSARPMPSCLAPGSWVSRRRMPKLGRVKLEEQSPLRSHSHTPDAGHGKIFIAVLRWALGAVSRCYCSR